jgi:geranylgeranyl pyrophosphate synthase
MNAFIQGLLDRSLFEPVSDFSRRQGKRIRGSLIQCVYEMAGGQGVVPEAVVDAIESLHAGSLVIDDVQDDSRSRRGRPTLHHQIGVPLAINAGNWIYFQALEYLSRSQLPTAMRCRLLDAMINAARVCHEGQAIDIEARVDRVPIEQWHDTVSAISLWKTGALVELAVRMGCIAAESSELLLSIMPPLGRRIGVALQMRNDLDEMGAVARGDFAVAGSDSFRDDDLRNARMTWPWVWGLERIGGRRCRELAMLLTRSADDRLRVARELIQAVDRQGNEAIAGQIDESMRLLAEHVIDRELLGRMGQILEAIRRPGHVPCGTEPSASPTVAGVSR